MKEARGPNSTALLRQLHARGLTITGSNEHAALITVLVQMARKLDAGEASAAMYSTYLGGLRQLAADTATKRAVSDDDSPAEALRRLRSV